MASLLKDEAGHETFHEVKGWVVDESRRPFTYPFAYSPDPRCREAAELVKRELGRRDDLAADVESGKMFGVLVCEDGRGRMGFIASFSGTLGGKSHQRWFVPPLLDYEREDGVFKTEERAISEINERVIERQRDPEYLELESRLRSLTLKRDTVLGDMKKSYAENREMRRKLRAENSDKGAELDRQSQFEKAEIKRAADRFEAEAQNLRVEISARRSRIESLKTERKRRSNVLQRWLFSRMKARCADGELVSIWDMFLEARRGVPPAGAGECAAPKLLNYAFENGLRPVCMAEFWMGESPYAEIRSEGRFYPACNSKCGPVLKRMMRGMDVESNPLELPMAANPVLKIVYEDEWLLIADKPHGLVTVSENAGQESLMSMVGAVRAITGPGYVHRLDQATSGLVVIAKDKETHAAMQRLFEERKVSKKYVAVVEGRVDKPQGAIRLPLIPNIEDRPRQMVDFVRGKEAVTSYVVVDAGEDRTRVHLYPLTGRTHQLRVHMASPLGLGHPIVGDNLYGELGERLLLHAEMVKFRHPRTGVEVIVESPADF